MTYTEDDARLSCDLLNVESPGFAPLTPVNLSRSPTFHALAKLIARIREAGDRPCSELLAELRPDPHREAREKAMADARQIAARFHEAKGLLIGAAAIRAGGWDDTTIIQCAFLAFCDARGIPLGDKA